MTMLVSLHDECPTADLPRYLHSGGLAGIPSACRASRRCANAGGTFLAALLRDDGSKNPSAALSKHSSIVARRSTTISARDAASRRSNQKGPMGEPTEASPPSCALVRQKQSRPLFQKQGGSAFRPGPPRSNSQARVDR